MKKIKLFIALIILGVFLISPIAQAHPGRTSADGKHFCRTRCDYWGYEFGERHFHAEKIKTGAKKKAKRKSKRKSK